MGRDRRVRIDGAMLENILRRREFSQEKAGEAVGVSKDVIGRAIRLGLIAKPTLRALELEFAIPAGSLLIKDEEPKEPEQTEMEMPAGLTYQEVTQAVAEGIRAAFEALFEEYAIYKVGGVQTVRKRAGREPEHDVLR